MKYFFSIFFNLLISITSFAYMNIYPLSFNQRIDGRGGIKDFILTNTTTSKIRYQINVKSPEDSNFNMSSWTEIYPKVITLNPGEKGSVKMYIRAPKDTPIGEYTTILNIKELEVPTKNREDRKGVNVFTNLNLKLYGYVGKLDSSISLDNLEICKGENSSQFSLKGKLKNKSQRRISLDFVLADSQNEMLICELKLKKNEVIDLSNLRFIFHDTAIKKYQDFNRFKIYEKETGKILMKGDI